MSWTTETANTTYSPSTLKEVLISSTNCSALGTIALASSRPEVTISSSLSFDSEGLVAFNLIIIPGALGEISVPIWKIINYWFFI